MSDRNRKAERACLLLSILPSSARQAVAKRLGSEAQAEVERVALGVSRKSAAERKRLLLEALASPEFTAILAGGETDRINQASTAPDSPPDLRKALLEHLDPRVWFYRRRDVKS